MHKSLSWRPGLDGLRGIAIIAVMLVHLKTREYVPGGSFGVDLFFVLSGFLITTLLLQEWQQTGKIDLRMFYLRRVLRLFPALVVFFLLFVCIDLVFDPYKFTGLSPFSAVASSVGYGLSYSLNWFAAFGGVAANGLGHIWSLSVEEQYYLLWPGVLLISLRLGLSPRALVLLTVIGIVCSAATPFLLSNPNWRRLHYGSDFRAHELLIGSLVAQFWAFGFLGDDITDRRPFRLLLCVAQFFFLFLVLTMNARAIGMYYGGFFLLAVSGAVMVWGAAFASSGFWPWLLKNPVLVYLGRRSYAIYLWHMAIVFWLRDLSMVEQLVCAVLLSVVAAELSFRIVERPCLRLKARFSYCAHRDTAQRATVGAHGQREADAAA